MLVTVFDYGAGNLHSLMKALDGPDVVVKLEEDPRRALATDLLVLPGVGAFGAAAARMAPARASMRDAIHDGLPCIGICLGMQLLMECSEEDGGSAMGLGVVPGTVERVRATRVPQMGWNSIEDAHDPSFDAAPLSMAYYANSYVCRPAQPRQVIAWSTHENDRFPAAVRVARTVGVQFHPEKSSAAGVRWLRQACLAARPTEEIES